MVRFQVALITAAVMGAVAVRLPDGGSKPTGSVAFGAPLPTRITFVLFDVSGSTVGRREQYRNDFEGVVKCSLDAGASRAVAGQRLVGDRITASPLATSEFRINHQILAYDSLQNPLVYRGQGRRIIEKAKEILREQGPERGSKIMEAMQLAERVFKTYSADQKLLVVFSDVYEQSDRYDFTSEVLTRERREAIVNRERSEGRLADLRGVKVYVVGALAGSATGGRSAASPFDIMNFWLSYFTAAGGDLAKERYGSALLAFEGCTPTPR